MTRAGGAGAAATVTAAAAASRRPCAAAAPADGTLRAASAVPVRGSRLRSRARRSDGGGRSAARRAIVQPITFLTETLVIQTVTPSAATISTIDRADVADERAQAARRARVPSQPPLRAERRVDDQEVRARCTAERRDHARHVDLEEHDRREQRDEQRKPAGGMAEERVQRGSGVRADHSGVRGRDDERDGEQKRDAERNDPGDLVVPTRRHARLPANASHCAREVGDRAAESPPGARNRASPWQSRPSSFSGGDQTGQELLDRSAAGDRARRDRTADRPSSTSTSRSRSAARPSNAIVLRSGRGDEARASSASRPRRSRPRGGATSVRPTRSCARRSTAR